MTNENRTLFLGMACLLASTTSALAWDPNEGAEDVAPANQTHAHYQPAPNYRPVKITPAPVSATYAPITAATAAPKPLAAAAPVAAYTAPTYVPLAPTPAYTATAASPSYSDRPIENQTRSRANRYSVGVEGFYDEYKERSVDVTTKSDYGSLTGEWTHYYDPNWFTTLDGRASYGDSDYKSPSGTANGISDWEFESRFVSGYDRDYGFGRHFKPFIGLGARYYRDELKGVVTNTGAAGYDRNITQFYLPTGFAFEFPAWGLQFAPKVEIDPLLYGHVESRLGTIPGYSNIDNDQHEGFGWRAEFLAGQMNDNGTGWQFGPFVRSWNIPDSKVDTDPAGRSWIEPKNTRIQAGATFKYLF